MSKTENTSTANLPHAEGCPAERVECVDYPDHGITTTHCCDCGAHVAQDRNGKTLKIPAVTGAFAGSRRTADHGVSMEQTGGDAA